MPRSLKSKFNGNTQEVIDYARTWGIHKAMDNFQVKDYLAFKRFLEGETGDKNTGISPLLGDRGNRSWAEDLLDAVLSKISKMETEKEYLKTELKRLNLELEYFKGCQAREIVPRVQEVLARCKI